MKIRKIKKKNAYRKAFKDFYGLKKKIESKRI